MTARILSDDDIAEMEKYYERLGLKKPDVS